MIDRRRLLRLAPFAAAAAAPQARVQARAGEPAAAPVAPFTRDEAAGIIAEARKIVAPDGVERLEAVRIGGIDQWVSVRGTDRRNPVLIYLHGGPGYVSMPMSWWFGRGWEDYFTVVHWDQRGAGKTYLLNDPAQVAPTLTLERMLADAGELVDWARRTLGHDKVFVLGHSWGTCLGLELARRRPEILHAYLGVGQLADGPESERRGWAFAVDAARRSGDAEAERQLQAIAPYFPPGRPSSLKDIYVQRKWLDRYGGVMAYRQGNEAESDLSRLSPDYSTAEVAHVWDGNPFSEKPLLREVLSLDYSDVVELRLPLLIFAGRHDVNVNSDVAAAWFARVKAPAKRFVWFEHSAHLPMTEEPGKFLVSLVEQLRPFAGAGG
ncbi:MAG TPA: alpha/beta fold hydrolase [Caulobacteraceae bacterium]